jgi:molybdenum cofactor guanylyltransferase
MLPIPAGSPTIAFMEHSSDDITLAILAGGEGSRMGLPKGLLALQGRPILACLLERFQWEGPTLLVTSPGREHPPGWDLFTAEVADPVAGAGPLQGLHTALAAMSGDLLVVTTVDMPMVGREQLGWLVEQMRARPEHPGLMLQRGEQVEPFPGIFRRRAIDMVAARLATSARSVQGLAQTHPIALLPAPPWPEETWINLNSPADLARFLER